MTLYTAAHRAERARWQARLDQGEAIPCTRCGKPVNPNPTTWDLGHTRNRQAWAGPQHVRCNRATRTHMAADRNRPTTPHPGVIT